MREAREGGEEGEEMAPAETQEEAAPEEDVDIGKEGEGEGRGG